MTFCQVSAASAPHTIRSYRDTLVLLLQFTARDARREVEQLTIRDLTEEQQWHGF
jgi:hypothetical protein